MTPEERDALIIQIAARVDEAKANAAAEAKEKAQAIADAAQDKTRKEAAAQTQAAAHRLQRANAARRDFWVDSILLTVSFVLAGVAVLSLLMAQQWPAIGVIAAVDAYLLTVLVVAVRRSDQFTTTRFYTWLFPRRVAGLAVVLLLLAALVVSFASLYAGVNVFKGDDPRVIITTSRLDAVYISFLTLGFSDFKPTSDGVKWAVIAELTSGVLILIGAFPLLISRIPTFDTQPAPPP